MIDYTSLQHYGNAKHVEYLCNENEAALLVFALAAVNHQPSSNKTMRRATKQARTFRVEKKFTWTINSKSKRR